MENRTSDSGERSAEAERPKRIFVSHSSENREFVEQEIIGPLHRYGIDTWYSTDNIDTATKWEAEIRKGLQSCDWFLVALSIQSVQSPWVEAEVAWALTNRANRFVPVLIEDCEWKDFHLMLSTYQCADFRRDLDEAKRRLLKRWGINYGPPGPKVLAPQHVINVARATVEVCAVEGPTTDVQHKEERRKVGQPPARTAIRSPAALRRWPVLGSAAIAVALFVLLALVFFRRPNGAGLDDSSQTLKLPGESSTVFKDWSTNSHTIPRLERNDGEKPTAPPSAMRGERESADNHTGDKRTEHVPNATRGVAGMPTNADSQNPAVDKVKAKRLSTVDLSHFEGTQAGQSRDDNGLGMRLVWIPPGTFTMGSPKDEPGRGSSEEQVRVTITRGFWFSQHEAMQGDWQEVMHETRWRDTENLRKGTNYPVSFVNWGEAVEFCDRLTAQERLALRLPSNWRYSLPTEAQWEYACRARSKSRFSFGNDESELEDFAWYRKNAGDAGEGYAHLIEHRAANPWGLFDVHGNVWEWCSDWYREKLVAGSDPVGPSTGLFRVIRGGSWSDRAHSCRSATRGNSTSTVRSTDLGFRVAAVPSGK
jgi:formylglycine-generating enzyme required for sulfatase activity